MVITRDTIDAPLNLESRSWTPASPPTSTQQGLAPNVQGVVPLTGDASDRRYFRVLAEGRRIDRAGAARRADRRRRRCPSSRWRGCCARFRCRCRRSCTHSNELGVLGLEDLGDVTLQAHLGAASPAEHAALYRQAVAFIATMQQRGAALASRRLSALRHRLRRREADLGARVLREALSVAYRGAALDDATRDALRQEWSGHRRRTGRRSRACCAIATTTAAT